MLNPNVSYPSKTTAPSASYPYGGAQDITVPGDGTGTPWVAAILNDFWGFIQALVSQESIVPSGSPDTVVASDILDALNSAITAATSSVAMKYSGATVFTGSMPTSFTDLDLSSVIGANRCLVHLSIAGDNTLSKAAMFRENGETLDVSGPSPGNQPGGTSTTNVINGYLGYITLITDTNGIVEWMSEGSGSGGTVVKLLTYQVLS